MIEQLTKATRAAQAKKEEAEARAKAIRDVKETDWTESKFPEVIANFNDMALRLANLGENDMTVFEFEDGKFGALLATRVRKHFISLGYRVTAERAKRDNVFENLTVIRVWWPNQ